MRLIKFYKSTIGKKVIAALSGAFLLFFVIGHMAGNLKAFGGVGPDGVHKLDHYAEFLRAFGQDILGYTGFLWMFRIALIVALVLHVVTVVQLKSLSTIARGDEGYRVSNSKPSKTIINFMFYGGLTTAFFIIFHILHLTLGTIHPDFTAGAVYSNIQIAFQSPYITVFYLLVMVCLGFHISHGAWSLFQTLGLATPSNDCYLRLFARVLGLVVCLGFSVVPVMIFLGVLR